MQSIHIIMVRQTFNEVAIRQVEGFMKNHNIIIVSWSTTQ